jgi:hypothetical protein
VQPTLTISTVLFSERSQTLIITEGLQPAKGKGYFFLRSGRWTNADPAALLAREEDLGLRRTLLAMLPTRFDVTSLLGILLLH